MDYREKLKSIFERKIKAKNAMRNSYVANSAPSSHEIGWLGHKRFSGSKDRVQIKFDPTDPKIKDEYLYHTHPSKNPTPLSAMPSGQDLVATLKMVLKHGLAGSVIFSGPFYVVVVPNNRASEMDRLNIHKYSAALRRGDIEDSIRQLDIIGFDIETGER